MRTFRLHAFGLENLRVEESDPPTPGRGEVLVRLRAASLNYRDLMVVKGRYNPRMRLPMVPLSDGAGEVAALGPEVDQWKIGDRVCPTFFRAWRDGAMDWPTRRTALGGGEVDGVMRDYAAIPADALVPMPAHLSYEEAATLPCAGLTAWHALVLSGRAKPGESVLTLGTGGVSVFAVQIARLLGATVIATSSSDEKLERVRALGAGETINHRRTPAWDDEVLRLTGSVGVDHVIEVGGAGTLPRSARAVRMGGHIALIGVLSGRGEFDPGIVQMKGVRLQGIYVGSRTMFLGMNRALEANGIHPVVDQVFDVSEFAEALACLERGGHFGKIVLRF